MPADLEVKALSAPEIRAQAVHRPIEPAAFYRAEHARQEETAKVRPEAVIAQLQKRVVQLESWIEKQVSKEKMLVRKKLASALQMPKQSQSEEQFMIKVTVENISYRAIQ